jgi:hypothetical protein
VKDSENYWEVALSPAGVILSIFVKGQRQIVASDKRIRLRKGRTYSLQILDDGRDMSITVDGVAVTGCTLADDRFGQATSAGLSASEVHGATFSFFEAHPRSVPMAPEIDMGRPWEPGEGRILVTEDFEGAPCEFAGSIVASSGEQWHRVLGSGHFDRTGNRSVRVRADVRNPNPGRTAYAIDWKNPSFADVEVEIVPPGSGPGQNERSRGGLIFWQDEDNYLAISDYLDDWHVGKSVSSFFRLNGQEDLYKAVWSCVGDRLHWGIPHRFRVAFDGNRYAAFLDGEMVLYRALSDVDPSATPLAIRKIGLLANWEFGDDTGTVFRRLVAKG